MKRSNIVPALFALALLIPALARAYPAGVRVPDSGPSLQLVCSGAALPFPLPSADESEDWTDDDYETWREGEWADYCDASGRTAAPGSYSHRACKCASMAGWF